MDRGQRLGRALDAFGGDMWALVDAALDAAARDRPDDLRARRDGIVERLYAAATAGCSNCAGRPPPLAALAAAGLDEEDGEEAAPASSAVALEAEADAQAGGAEERAEELGAGAPGLESKIVAIRDFLDDPNQPEDELVRLLQSLADMDVTYSALQETDIGRQVNGLRKHSSAEVRRLVKQLIRKWKEIVDEWVRLHNSGSDGSATVMTDGDSPDKIQGRSHQSPRVSGFQYSPSPQRQNGSASERAINGFDSTMDAKRRASPVPAHHNSKQMNNNHNSATTTSSAPAFSVQKVTREQRQSLLDLDKLDSARKRLQENYQEAQNAKKQRTIQVMDINDIPKPKNRNAFIRKSASSGLPARNR
ncbi:probable mediator of RNA polymerase II transcription subunit 26c isoform X2 [Sorghum bicolor]|uniref:probable mediator of RNA polymerase II transcription subunit 26c isoform X2 n=1 Tax=Sorghum bicolor TaxID=4558 RepID=UPI000B423C89|nr:probable mediator of RNA polymerase II transcription subunit 26c isoform X2 [Sorghum bicolor]|eukprot:XP_021316312.1 probable mediator of RNA polymerase II transcription subunit 26c isoform X2 [Sorghum bicolor]